MLNISKFLIFTFVWFTAFLLYPYLWLPMQFKPITLNEPGFKVLLGKEDVRILFSDHITDNKKPYRVFCNYSRNSNASICDEAKMIKKIIRIDAIRLYNSFYQDRKDPDQELFVKKMTYINWNSEVKVFQSSDGAINAGKERFLLIQAMMQLIFLLSYIGLFIYFFQNKIKILLKFRDL